MKLGITMLIVGLALAAFGVFCTGCPTSEPEAEWMIPMGWALVVFGGGLSIGGIVRMIIKR